jgi:8-oxo-dGTP pyrophosphatase MutT (NUDIX family)
MFTPGHITCTGLVLAPGRDRLLLVHHRRLNRWLLPGGHIEPEDGSVAETARREAVEETGVVLTNAQPVLVGIDVHPIPGRGREPLHLHHNLSFAFEARELAMRPSVEVRDVMWCRFDDYDRFDLPGNIRRSVSRALKWAATSSPVAGL